MKYLYTEHQEQVFLCRWLNSRDIVYCANANEGKRTLPAMYWLKQQGWQKGTPDLFIFSMPLSDPYFLYQGVAIELKKRNFGKHKLPCKCMKPEQFGWKDKLERCHWHHILAHGAEEAIQELIKLGF